MTRHTQSRAAASVILLAALSSCSGEDPPERGTPSTLSVEVTQDATDGACEGSIEWYLDPRATVGNLAGTIDEPISDQVHYANRKPEAGECIVSFGAEGLRPGVWHLSTSVGSCTVLVQEPVTAIRLDDSIPECESM